MIQTSYFAKAASLPNAVAISQGIPTWYKGARYRLLAPSWDLIQIKDPELYKERYYREVLSKLDPLQVASDLEGCILLCHEKDSTHCHRRIVAEWLEAALGIKVPEMEYAVKKMRVIYGRDVEGSNLVLNLYAGCSHDCWYCYNKRPDRYQGPYDKSAKGATLRNIEEDLKELQGTGDKRPVLMSLVGDPYDMGRKDYESPKGLFQYLSKEEQQAIPGLNDSYTRTVLRMFRAYDHPFAILTKGGTKAVKDFDLYGVNDQFGVSLTFDNNVDSKKYEPGAALPADRIDALQIAHERGIQTWVSLEPVLDPAQTLHLIEMSNDFVDMFWVGKLNHSTKGEARIDWPKFRSDAEALLQKCGKGPGIGYVIKKELIDAI
jgi:DNA repair photolyase